MVPVLKDFPGYKSILKPYDTWHGIEVGGFTSEGPMKMSERRACLSGVLKGQ